MPSHTEISAAELHAMMQGKSRLLLIDVRTIDEIAKGMIPGAIHIPLSQLELRARELDSDEPLVFYCHSGIRSAQASSFLAHQGRGNVFNLRGGILAWNRSDYPLTPELRSK